MEVTSGIRSILSNANAYDFVQNALGAARYRAEIARTYVRQGSSDPLRILDVGCGTAHIFQYLRGCTYVGLDHSALYIEAATRRYGELATFVQTNAASASFERWQGQFDCVLMLGLLHHLDDHEVVSLLRSAGGALAPGGRLLAVDPTVAPHTPAVAKFLVSRDRGRNVRSPEGYEALGRRAFAESRVHLRHDLLWVPYTHAILECSNGRSSQDGD
jgi:SAM-dependent methyltransferase